ncbi:MAG: hypothetical protein BVN34_02505 [Proteobacteria bacterium ST_bin12]|nr:MAG: hypothetical protein BVN34_02505 [Proteobacteria bacterium ST_bin12]
MKTDSLGQTLVESLNNAELWIRQAEQQFLVAEAIAPKIGKRATTEADNLLKVGYLKTTSLLLALSVENSFKAIKASRNELSVDTKGLIKTARGGGSTGHSLIDLADEVQFSLNSQQVNLLKKLTAIGIWAGKYHSPIRHDEFEKSNKDNPKSITLPHDIRIVKEVILECALSAKVQSAIALQIT